MINDEIIESYLNCKYKTYRKVNNEHGIKTEFGILQEEQLSMCKTEFYNHLLEKYGENNLLKCYNFGKNRRISKVNVLIQPILNTEKYRISFDAIEIIPDKKPNSKTTQIPILVSSKEKISKIEKLFIAIKCIILSKTCRVEYEFGRIIYGSGLKTIKFKIEPFLNEAKKMLAELDKLSLGIFKPLLFQKNHCKICEFQEVCNGELMEKDSLGLLHRMREENIKKFNRNGIFTVNQLSYTFRPRKKPKRTKNHPYYFSLQALAIREQKVYLYDRIDLPNVTTKVFIDMEGNSDGSFVYLIGVLVVEKGQCKKYSLWADDFDNEREIFNECMKILSGLDDFHIFYFGKYESRVFKRMLRDNSSTKLKNFLMNKFTNILTVIYSNLYFPTYSNGLKDVGKYLSCSWSARNASGIQSIVWRKKWEDSKDNKLKDTLITYNFEDCIALKAVTDFIYEVFNRNNSEGLGDKLQSNIAFVEEIKSESESKQSLFGDLVAVSKDFEVVNKCAYFEYQRNKIYFRKNKTIRKNIKRKEKQANIKYRPNKIIEIKSYKCPYCKSKGVLHSRDRFYTRICLDLRFLPHGIKRWITIYRMPIHSCSSCKKEFMPKKFRELRLYYRRSNVPQKYKEQKGYGHNLLAWTVHQNIVNRITFRDIESAARDYFGLPVGNRRGWELKCLAAEYYEATYHKILKKMVQGHLIHADETKVGLRDNIGYVWVLATLEEVLYIYRPTREAGFLHELLKGFEGVLISDFYSGYDSLNCLQQKCLIHLIRDLNDEVLKNPFDDELKKIVTRFGSLVINIIGTIDRFGLKSRYLKKHKKEVKRYYKWLSKQIFNSDSAEGFKKRLIKYEKKLFIFLDHDNVPWNNNNAEVAIKYFANHRSRLKGKTTENGIKKHLILLSIYQTCKYKEINFLDFLLSKEQDIDKYIPKCHPNSTFEK